LKNIQCRNMIKLIK